MKTTRRNLLLLSALLIGISCAQGADDPYFDEEGDLDTFHRGLLKQLGGTNGDGDYCNTGASVCTAGEGDCDGRGHCAPGLQCVQNVGSLYGFSAGTDVCSLSTCFNNVQDLGEDDVDCQNGPGACRDCAVDRPGTNGEADYCTYLPCGNGEGDCDSNLECQAGLSCVDNQGAKFGLSSGVDVCLALHCSNGTQDSAQGETGVDCGGPCGSCIVPGQIIVSEIMQNPKAVSDTTGEWVEVYNTTNNSINLQGWTIRDDGSDSHTISGSLVVPPKGYAVLGRSANMGSNGGVTVNYVYSGFVLSNSADEVVLVAPNGFIVDRVNYDGGATFPDPNGASMTLNRSRYTHILNDAGSAWCDGLSQLPGGDEGTPGTTNDICPID